MDTEDGMLYSDEEHMSICEDPLTRDELRINDVDEEQASPLDDDDEHSSDGSSTSSDAGEVDSNSSSDILRRLEDIVLSVMSQLANILSSSEDHNVNGRKISVELVDRKKPLRSDGTFGMRTIAFPHKSRHGSAKQLAQFLRVIDLIHEAVSSGTPATKRDMYYKDVTLFGSQAVVDRLIDDISATMDVSRADLCVRASAKGLFCGSTLVLHLHGGDSVRGNDTEGALIPPSEDISRFEVGQQLSWVLVVEKEAVFQTLCHLQFARHPALPGPGLIITGKGYPDVATRQLVSSLAQNLDASIPILGVVDADPFGIDILSVYKYGSSSMAHQDGLDAPRLRWVGVMASELASLGVEKEQLIAITKHDEKKALSMLKRNYMPRKWRKELQHMLHNRRKAEIEILSASHATTPSFSQTPGRECLLVRYLTSKILKAIQSSAGKTMV
ncbi:Spo11/DNA topoisomerase VI subunit A [Irpex lacteus]|nr:Spo11/DNA topoisomerase VI subunit A [Irpex lacteus]